MLEKVSLLHWNYDSFPESLRTGILISKPFYNGFAASFECRSGIVAIGVDLEEGFENSIDALEAYERALIESEARGVKVRAIMICVSVSIFEDRLQIY